MPQRDGGKSATGFALYTAGLGVLVSMAIWVPAFAQTVIFSSGFESDSILEWDPPTVYRFSDFDLRDPHVFVDFGPLGCQDITDDGGPIPGVNELTEAAITMDSEPDGFLDLSLLLQFRPLDPAGTGQRADQRVGQCTAPLAGTTCTHDPDRDAETFWYDTLDVGGGTCLEPVSGSTSGYVPGISSPLGPCFYTMPGNFTVGFLGLEFDLEQSQLGATFVGGAPLELSDGLVRGFLSEADADALIFPATAPIIGGAPLSSLLPGGAFNCNTGDDTDLLDTTRGWWFYFNFPAVEVPYAGY